MRERTTALPPERRSALRTAGWLIAGLFGLGLYLWPALTAPVVLWSDSRVDLDLARSGAGIWSPLSDADHVRAGIHPIKPGYLLFLAAARRLPGLEETRSIVVVQSVLLWASIALTALWISRSAGRTAGLLLYFVLLFTLRLRDAGSQVMSEAIAAALFLPLVAAAAVPWPGRREGTGSALAGLAAGALFLVRPNAGAVAVGLLVIALLLGRRVKGLVLLFVAFGLALIPFWLLSQPRAGGDPGRGLAGAFYLGSVDDYWAPELPAGVDRMGPRELAEEFQSLGAANWRRLLTTSSPDRPRQLLWRALHGLFGIEFYDARWSSLYDAWDIASRRIWPVLLLAAIAVVGGGLAAEASRPAALLGVALLLAVVAQNLVLGSLPRLALPLLPGLIVLAVVSRPSSFRPRQWGFAAAAAVAGGLLLRGYPSVLAWQSGFIEASGISILQPIPRRSLPASGPATLHIRVAPSLLTADVGVRVYGPSEELLYDDRTSPGGTKRPEIAVALPPSVLAMNRGGTVTLRVESTGQFGDVEYLLFPVIPTGWAPEAKRMGSPDLSPRTGIRRGGLDWWVHEGAGSPANPRVIAPGSPAS